MNLTTRRPPSSAPQRHSRATPSEKNPTSCVDDEPLPHRTSRENLFCDTYGQPVLLSTPLRRSYAGSSASHRGTHSSPRHHDTTRSPSAAGLTSHSPTLPPPSAHQRGTFLRNTRPISAAPTRGSACADAIAFQYYARQRQQRQQQGEAQREDSRTPPRTRATSSDRGASAPTTPGHPQRTPPHNGHGRPPLRGGLPHPRSQCNTPPLLRTTHSEASIQDTTASLPPSTPPRSSRRHTTGSHTAQTTTTVGKRVRAPLWTSPQQPPAAQHHIATTEALSDPSSPVAGADVTTAASSLCDAQRLLHYYGGFHATTAGTAVSATHAGPGDGEKCCDGRTALLEALQRHMDILRCAGAPAATPPSSPAAAEATLPRPVKRGRSRDGNKPAATSANAAAPPRRKEFSPSPAHNASGAGSDAAGEGRRTRGTSAGVARAPRQLRSRVMESRVSTRGRGRGKAGRSASSASSGERRSSPPAQDFMKSIKPPHRHGLGGAPPPSSTPSSPRTPILERLAHAQEMTLTAVHGGSKGSSASSSDAAEQQGHHVSGNAALRSPPVVREIAPGCEAGENVHEASVSAKRSRDHRIVPLADVMNDRHPGGGADISGSELSPGAAAARRVYWEQQQQQQQRGVPHRSASSEYEHFSTFEPHAGKTPAAEARYTESVSIDPASRHGPTQQRHEFESESLDDSVLRSDAHFSLHAASTATTIGHDAVAATMHGSDSTALAHNGGYARAPTTPMHSGVVVSLAEQLTPPLAQSNSVGDPSTCVLLPPPGTAEDFAARDATASLPRMAETSTSSAADAKDVDTPHGRNPEGSFEVRNSREEVETDNAVASRRREVTDTLHNEQLESHVELSQSGSHLGRQNTESDAAHGSLCATPHASAYVEEHEAVRVTSSDIKDEIVTSSSSFAGL